MNMSFESHGFTYLIGHPITKIEIGNSGAYLRLTAFGVEYAFGAFGDCCSHSWIEHIDGVAALHSGIVEVEEVTQTVDEKDNRDELVQVYFYKLITALGNVTIEMRNASNGYYGGWLETCPHGTPKDVVWKTITEDF
jgi:hypothetical protein